MSEERPLCGENCEQSKTIGYLEKGQESFRAELDRMVADHREEMRISRSECKACKASLKNDYVSKVEFEPIKKLVYGLVTLILMAVAEAVRRSLS